MLVNSQFLKNRKTKSIQRNWLWQLWHRCCFSRTLNIHQYRPVTQNWRNVRKKIPSCITRENCRCKVKSSILMVCYSAVHIRLKDMIGEEPITHIPQFICLFEYLKIILYSCSHEHPATVLVTVCLSTTFALSASNSNSSLSANDFNLQ